MDSSQDELNEPEGESVKDFQLELVKGKFIDDLIEGIIGMQVGETKEISVTLPQEYFQDELAGRQAEFTVNLKEIKAKELPPLDDDFAQDVSEFSTLEELRQFLEEQYQQEAKDSTDANVEAALMEALIEELEVDLPESMIDDELNVMVRETLSRLQSNGLDINKLVTKEMLSEMKERMRSDAIPRLQRTLALAEVAKSESIKVEADAIGKRCQEILQDLQGQEIDRDRLEAVVEDELLQKQVMAWLTEHSNIELVEPKLDGEINSDSADSEKKDAEAATQGDKQTAAKKSKTTAKKSTAKTKSKEADTDEVEVKPKAAKKTTKSTETKATDKGSTPKKTTPKAKKTSTKTQSQDQSTDAE